MKNIVILIILFAVTSCHDHDKDLNLGSISQRHKVAMTVMKKHVIDSMRTLINSKVPSTNFVFDDKGAGWYSSEEMKLPPGIITGFVPENESKDGPPFYILVKGLDGKRTINKTNRERWLILQKGDIIK